MLYPTILAGGIGTRLWPLSRSALPKQFVEFFPDQPSLFEATLSRLEGLDKIGKPTIVCSDDHRFLVAESLKSLSVNESSILLEPMGRNTAPAIALAAFDALQNDADAALLVLPADHVIADKDKFHEAINAANEIAETRRLVTFGIVPGSPETGFGYIRCGNELVEGGQGSAFEVAEFVEKPDYETAKIYLQDGSYLWNSGMFLFRADVYLEELKAQAPDIHLACEATFQKIESDIDFKRIPTEEFSACRSESIDYAVMEKTSLAAMVPLDAGWSDLGAWDALWKHAEQDERGNVKQGDVIEKDLRGSYIHAQSRLVAALGISNSVIVETPDAVLVADRSRMQEVKDLVDQLGDLNRSEKNFHTLVYRPWGSFESLAQGNGFQVKHIVVNPGAAISLQRHQHRSEHWTVVKGSALIHCDGEEFTLDENESTFIPLGAKHRLSNPGEVAVEIIEVQVGSYLGEDDIERFEDLYGR